MVCIAPADLAILSDVHFIIAAEAGVKAKAESIAAAINILIAKPSLQETGEIADQRNTHLLPRTFRGEDIFMCRDAM
ncbi:hypothetical protein [Bradyrhizobium sp. NP1]|uniref:hypothetical protein n=1 Tax=Bradyrhizobium sp. NP1 TaxID=3049772 RepID=UPI0025A52D33|nr:hypothetical protein [Bradyrhizobium sp. NP1]WJR82090.1 hypothetical protein QOU61_09905 [Bradyrhizobium sp. NP1]